MTTNEHDPNSFAQISEEEFMDMLNYDPSTDPCELLWPVMNGVFALELANLVMQKNRMEE